MKRLIFGVLALANLSLSEPVLAQTAIATVNKSAPITTGNTFQLFDKANQDRKSLEILNNNAVGGDDCVVNVDGAVVAGNTTATSVTPPGGNGTMTAAQASIPLAPRQSYTRYYPHVPLGPIVGTCTQNTDSLYVAVQ